MKSNNFISKTTKLLSNYYDELAKIKTLDLPACGYHYTDAGALKNIISQNTIWLSDIEYLNDETETKYIYELIEDMFENNELRVNERLGKALLDRCNYVKSNDYFQQEFGISYKEKNFVISLSKEPDNLILWNNYTKNINKIGYNIGFKREDLLQCLKERLNKKDNIIHGNVIYDINIQKDLINRLIYAFNDLLGYENASEMLVFQYIGMLLNVYALFFKKQCFENEKEYRIIIGKRQDINGRDISCDFRICNGLLIPYYQFSFSKECVSSISISPTVKEELYNASIRRLLNRYEYSKDVNVLNSTIPLRY